jgi:hypothetical protein
MAEGKFHPYMSPLQKKVDSPRASKAGKAGANGEGLDQSSPKSLM